MQKGGDWTSDLDRAYVTYMESVVKHDHRPRAREIRDDVGELPPGATVVDVAGGPAFLLLELAPLLPGARLVLVDPSATMLAHGVERARARGFELTTVESPAEAIGLPDGTADLLVCKHFLRLAPDLDGALGEMHRILKPGGRAYFVDFNGAAPRLGKIALWAWVRATAPPEIGKNFWDTIGRGLTVPAVLERLARAGFQRGTVLHEGVAYVVRAEQD